MSAPLCNQGFPAGIPSFAMEGGGRRAEGLSVIIPAFNESGAIREVLGELLASLEPVRLQMPVEVIVVDDGSSDGTAGVLQDLGDGIRLVRHATNRGYGAALKSGLRASRYSWMLITDADGTYPSRFIKDLLEKRADNDMVVGARTGAIRAIPWLRRPPKWVLRKLAAYLSNRDIPDLNSGFRLMRAEVVEKFVHLLPDGFSFTTTITLAMIASGFRVEYLPIDYLKREGKSKIKPIADTLNFLKLIIRTILYFDPLRVFLPVSLAFLVGSVFVGVGSYLLLGKLLDVTTVLLFVTGIQLLALGMIADALNRRIR